MNIENPEELVRQLNSERKKVDVSSISFSVRELVRMHSEGELSIAPSYQRKYRWSESVAATFVESLYLGLPIPPIFVATNDDFQWEVVDGLQRISTLIQFLADSPEQAQAVNRPAPLRLEGLEKLPQLNGSTFSTMPTEIRRYFARQPIQVVSLTDKSDKAVRFDLFERLNSGAIALSAQEVRAAVYRGEFNDFIDSLEQNRHLDSLLKLQQSNQHDGTRAEQVLKFFAYKNSRQHFDGSVTKFLNKFAGEAEKDFSYDEERALFERTFEFLAEVVDGPFVRTKTPVTPLVQFEACGVGIAELIQEGSAPTAPALGWLEDDELVRSSTGGTNTRAMLKRRIERAKVLFSGN